MAKKSMIAREKRRADAVLKHAIKREEYKSIIKNPSSSGNEIQLANIALQRLPRDSSKVRMRSRCKLTGRPHGFYRKFGLSRNKLREATMRGDVPGLFKASW